MNVGVLGTGVVGRTIATKLVQLGHEVTLGSRTAENDAAASWAEEAGAGASHGTFADAAADADLVFNCTGGAVSVAACDAAGAERLAGKTLVDVSNPLDFSHGFPPTLTVCNTDSVAEQLQRRFPDARVVKALNTVNAAVMTSPGSVPGEHDVFICGDDERAKAEVRELLKAFGWPDASIRDLGDIGGARGMEMYLPLWLRLMGQLGTPAFNIRVVTQN